jgi:hypothetical protein
MVCWTWRLDSRKNSTLEITGNWNIILLWTSLTFSLLNSIIFNIIFEFF